MNTYACCTFLDCVLYMCHYRRFTFISAFLPPVAPLRAPLGRKSPVHSWEYLAFDKCTILTRNYKLPGIALGFSVKHRIIYFWKVGRASIAVTSLNFVMVLKWFLSVINLTSHHTTLANCVCREHASFLGARVGSSLVMHNGWDWRCQRWPLCSLNWYEIPIGIWEVAPNVWPILLLSPGVSEAIFKHFSQCSWPLERSIYNSILGLSWNVQLRTAVIFSADLVELIWDVFPEAAMGPRIMSQKLVSASHNTSLISSGLFNDFRQRKGFVAAWYLIHPFHPGGLLNLFTIVYDMFTVGFGA